MTARFLLPLVTLLPCLALRAEVKLPAIFGDHMVLQQGVEVPVWGTAAPDEAVTVSFSGKTAKTTASPEGKWKLKLDALPASDKPAEFTVAGTNTLVFKDVLVGEVWVCSGQSNMVASRSSLIAKEVGAKRLIHFFKSQNTATLLPQTDVKGKWVVCTPEEANPLSLSAVGYHFAVHVQQATNVPVGMIQTAWSGTGIAPWIDFDSLAASPRFKNLATRVEGMRNRPQPEAAPAPAPGAKPAPKPKQPAGVPSAIYNGMVHPHVPYAIKGAIWYQGESNAGNEENAKEYMDLLPLLISSWRNVWGQGDFPFLVVQLPAYSRGAAWPWLRQAQFKALSVPNTGLAVALDLNPTDNLHPNDKSEVGRRLALQARAVAYGEKGVFSGPLFTSIKVEGATVRVSFKETGSGLTLGGPPAAYKLKVPDPTLETTLQGFEVAGADGAFVIADASIDGDTVLVSSATVLQPVHVRYAWAAWPKANLYNKEGLPASPFTTGESPLSQPKKTAK